MVPYVTGTRSESYQKYKMKYVQVKMFWQLLRLYGSSLSTEVGRSVARLLALALFHLSEEFADVFGTNDLSILGKMLEVITQGRFHVIKTWKRVGKNMIKQNPTLHKN